MSLANVCKKTKQEVCDDHWDQFQWWLFFWKFLDLFVSITSTDAPETALKEVFPKIKFFKEKVSQKSDK